MARSINRLSPRTVASLSKTGAYADGGGLYLQISKWETKAWIFRFMLDGRSRQMGLGPIHTVTLAEARAEALECRKLLRDRIDPIEHRKAKHNKIKVDAATAISFKECAEKYISVHSDGWKNAKHLSQWQNTLAAYVYPTFGDLPVSAIDTGLVMRALEPIWATKTETASRVRGRIESVLDWAKALEYREGENPARWKGHLANLLPARAKVRKVAHLAAIPYEDIGTFMAALRKREGAPAKGLEFLILTATRTGETVGAQWDEIDFNEAVWTVPAERTKTDTEHRVPLSPAALDVLEAMLAVTQSDYIFPGSRANRPLGNAALLLLLKRLGHGDLTAHGFRSTFRDWAAERTAFPRDVAEMALGHTVANKVEAAYRRGDLFDKRAKLMDAWAEYCSAPEQRAGNVTNLRA